MSLGELRVRDAVGKWVRERNADGVVRVGVVRGLWVDWEDPNAATTVEAGHVRVEGVELTSRTHFVELVEERYGEPLTQVADMEKCGCKMPSLERVSTLVLAGSALSTAIGQWSTRVALPRLVDLDVSNCKLDGFQHVMGLLHNLPALRFLAVSRNKLPIDAATRAACQAASFPHLRTLVMNEVFLRWNDIRLVLGMLPNIAEVSLAGNGYVCLGVWLPRSACCASPVLRCVAWCQVLQC